MAIDPDVRVLIDEIGGRLGRSYHVGRAFMVLDAVTPAELADAANAGVTHALVFATWGTLQASEGGPVDVSSVLTDILNARAAGLLVCLEVRLQYPPAHVTTSGVKLKDQDENEWSAGQGSGANIRDWIWDGTTRGFVEDFLDKLFAMLTWDDIDRVRLGGLNLGELSFPQTSGTAREFWGHSAPAQTGVGIAAGMGPCPVPDHLVSATPNWVDDDRTFVAWYNQSLINWMQWYAISPRGHIQTD